MKKWTIFLFFRSATLAAQTIANRAISVANALSLPFGFPCFWFLRFSLLLVFATSLFFGGVFGFFRRIWGANILRKNHKTIKNKDLQKSKEMGIRVPTKPQLGNEDSPQSFADRNFLETP